MTDAEKREIEREVKAFAADIEAQERLKKRLYGGHYLTAYKNKIKRQSNQDIADEWVFERQDKCRRHPGAE